ncbi:ABC transporter ATP-binding protein [Kineothrix sp. MB12-C1]|uniref:ABC transporter ATP-binding protein n=1 Tax=Kineothrix sp. MB12-C1 TaxID=3070215 RepID=UPI0027D1F74E|nr:ABC transporter ATP-binding protein [Kineothrix sp. MB12-C1]WMC91692.1 ABC transporter ATP-binding protein [Kineothrix sp. MB12-C1]
MIKKLGYIFNKQDKIKMVGLLFLVVIGSFLELLGVTIFMPFIEIIMDSSKINENEILKFLYTEGNFQAVESFLAFIAAVIIAVYIVKNIFLWVEQDCILKFSYNTQRKLSTKLLTTYLNEPYTFHLRKNVAELQRSTQEDTGLFTQALMHALQLIAELAVCMVLGIYLFVVSQSITMVILVLLVACVAVFTYTTKKFAKTLGKEAQVYKAKLYQWVNQSIGGVKEVKVLNRESFFVDSYQKYYKLYIRGLRINRLLGMTPKYIVEAVCMTGLLCAVIVKLFFGRRDIESFIPQLAVFAVAAFRLLPAVGRINEHVNNILYASPSVDLIYHDLREIENYQEQIGEEENKIWSFERGIAVKSITYSYPESENPVLNQVSCFIPKGKTVAFIGSSGAGKTTMVDIILGLLPPQFGKIRVDDMNVYKNLSTWHKHLGYIPQAIYLSDDTIRNNVAFGILQEEIDDVAIMEALKKAQLWEFIDNLPEGLDTFVGDRGVRLSGGQRQRIGIARALYHDPEILVLDEATSALDSETETAVMEAIESLQGMKTIIIIAHRLTTIRNADVIYEVVDGNVIEREKSYVFKEEMEK